MAKGRRSYRKKSMGKRMGRSRRQWGGKFIDPKTGKPCSSVNFFGVGCVDDATGNTTTQPGVLAQAQQGLSNFATSAKTTISNTGTTVGNLVSPGSYGERVPTSQEYGNFKPPASYGGGRRRRRTTRRKGSRRRGSRRY
jgi:hypothetical protein